MAFSSGGKVIIYLNKSYFLVTKENINKKSKIYQRAKFLVIKKTLGALWLRGTKILPIKQFLSKI